MTKFYISLLVYNYDASPRGQRVRKYYSSEEKARRTAWRLQRLIGWRSSDNRSGAWLERNFRIYGFVEAIDGIYREETTQLAEGASA